jgi:hypothetical protein
MRDRNSGEESTRERAHTASNDRRLTGLIKLSNFHNRLALFTDSLSRASSFHLLNWSQRIPDEVMLGRRVEALYQDAVLMTAREDLGISCISDRL